MFFQLPFTLDWHVHCSLKKPNLGKERITYHLPWSPMWGKDGNRNTHQILLPPLFAQTSTPLPPNSPDGVMSIAIYVAYITYSCASLACSSTSEILNTTVGRALTL